MHLRITDSEGLNSQNFQDTFQSTPPLGNPNRLIHHFFLFYLRELELHRQIPTRWEHLQLGRSAARLLKFPDQCHHQVSMLLSSLLKKSYDSI